MELKNKKLYKFKIKLNLSLILFLFIFNFNSYVYGNQILAATADYINQFKSYNELIDTLNFFGVFTATEKAKIINLLKANNLDLNSKPTRLYSNDHSLFTDKKNGFTFLKNSKIQTFNGQQLIFLKKLNHFELFTYLLEIQKKKSKSTKSSKVFLNLLLSTKAYAADETNIADLSILIIGFIVKESSKALIGDVIYPTLGGITALFGGFNEYILFPLSNWLKSGKITCDRNTHEYLVEIYESKNKNRSLIQHWNLVKNRPQNICNKDSTFVVDEVFKGHHKTICNVWEVGSTYLRNSFSIAGESMKVENEVLENQFGTPIPKCDPKNAKLLEDKMKGELKNHILETTRILRSSSYESSPSKSGSNQ